MKIPFIGYSWLEVKNLNMDSRSCKLIIEISLLNLGGFYDRCCNVDWDKSLILLYFVRRSL